MKGQDVVVALRLTQEAAEAWSYAGIGRAAGLSAAEAHASVKRLRLAGLLRADEWAVMRSSLVEFLVHGLRYVFPVQPGAETVGVPTATAHPDVKAALRMTSGPSTVWPSANGSVRGPSVKPLYRTVPGVALRDERQHELLALVDCLRLGQARERAGAAKLIEARLAG